MISLVRAIRERANIAFEDHLTSLPGRERVLVNQHIERFLDYLKLQCKEPVVTGPR